MNDCLTVFFSAAGYAFLFLFPPVLVLVALLTRLRVVYIRILIHWFAGSLSALSALFICWHGFVSFYSKVGYWTRPKPPVRFHPVTHLPGGWLPLIEHSPGFVVRIEAAMVMRAPTIYLRLDSNIVDNFSNALDGPRKHFGTEL